MNKVKADEQTLRKFSVVMFFAFVVIGTLLFLKHKSIFVLFYAIAVIFFVLRVFAVNLLKPVYTGWMRFAFALSFINTRLILFFIFYLMFVPIGLIMKLFGMDLLDLKINRQRKSYWQDKEKKQPSYERQF